MKIKKQMYILLTALFVILAGCFMTTDAQAATRIDISVSTNTKYKAVIKWKKRSVTKYYIYRASVNKDGDWGKLKKIATISGKKTSYTDKKVKKNSEYEYLIKGYKKGKLKYISYSAVAYTGIGKGYWQEYADTDAAYSTSFIELKFASISGIKPDGLEISRRVLGTKTYKTIKTISGKSTSYKDKTVTPGKSYQYRFRAYKKISGKKVYGPYSSAMKKSAVNRNGIYTVSMQAPSSVDASMVQFKIKSDALNGKLSINELLGGWVNDEIDYVDDMELKKYSYDGTTWRTFSEGTSLNAGKTIYLLVSIPSTVDLNAFSTNSSYISFLVNYNDIPYIMSISPARSKAKMQVNGEFIH